MLSNNLLRACIRSIVAVHHADLLKPLKCASDAPCSRSAERVCQAVLRCSKVRAGQASMPMFGSGQSGQPFLAHQGSYAPMTCATYPHSQNTYGEFSMPGMMSSSPAYNGGFYQDASGRLQPLNSPAAPAASTMVIMHPQSQHMVQVCHACCLQGSCPCFHRYSALLCI